MSQVRDAVQRGNPRDVKRVLNLRGEDIGTDTAAFGGILSSTEDTVQKALDAIDDVFGSAVSITGNLSVTGNGTFISTDAGASSGPILDIYRNSASPAASDFLGRIEWSGEDSVGNKQSYGRIAAQLLDPTSGSEDGRLIVYTVVGATFTERFAFGAGFYTWNATGGDKGADTINASAIYDDNVQIKPTLVFRSSGSAITANATHTFAHSLAAEPDTVLVIIQCTTADLNYSVGDRVVLFSNYETGVGTDVGISVTVDTTNVVVYVADQIDILNKTTFEVEPITAASWEIYVKAAYFV